MCQIVVFIRDKTNPDDVYKDARLYKAGDVIEVVPDKWNWGREDLANPDWRIVSIPDLGEEEARQFLGPELNVSAVGPAKMLRRRAFKLDLSILPADFLADDARKLSLELTRLDVLGAKTAKPALTDPAVIGDPATDVIG